MAGLQAVGSINLAGRDLLKLSDLSPAELAALLVQAAQLKRDPYRVDLRGRVLGLLFQKASTRTRVSFTAAMAQCGGSTLDLVPTAMQMSRGEPLQDTARVLSRYLDAIAIRTYNQRELEIFAEYAEIPVINALTDQFHPCQVLADLLTIQENFGQLAGLTLAYCGDGNNVAHSLLLGCAMSGIHIRVATPPRLRARCGSSSRSASLGPGIAGVGVAGSLRSGRGSPGGLYRRVGQHGPRRPGRGAQSRLPALPGQC